MKKTRWIVLLTCVLLAAAFGAAYAEEAGQEIRPREFREEDIDTENGSFCLEIEDTDKIETEGYFTAALYLEDRYEPEQIENMKAGDRALVSGKWYTVSEVVIHEYDRYEEDENGNARKGKEITYEIYPKEEFWGYIVFNRNREGYYTATEDDWEPITLVKRVKIMLPLPDAFLYHEMSSGGADEDAFPADELLDMLCHPEVDEDEETGEKAETPTCFFNPYNTYVQFKDGLMTDIYSFSYPYGPEE